MLELQRIRFAGWELTEGQQAISKFSLQVLQPLPGIQKGIFEIQLAGNSACRLTVEQAGHALPVKWCLKEKVLLGIWSAIAMLELQRIQFAGQGGN